VKLGKFSSVPKRLSDVPVSEFARLWSLPVTEVARLWSLAVAEVARLWSFWSLASAATFPHALASVATSAQLRVPNDGGYFAAALLFCSAVVLS
jgi:hypothetical protein